MDRYVHYTYIQSIGYARQMIFDLFHRSPFAFVAIGCFSGKSKKNKGLLFSCFKLVSIRYSHRSNSIVSCRNYKGQCLQEMVFFLFGARVQKVYSALVIGRYNVVVYIEEKITAKKHRIARNGREKWKIGIRKMRPL